MRNIKDHTTALVIDIQEVLYPHIKEHEILLANCQKLIRGLNVLDIPLLVTEQYSKGLGSTLKSIKEILPSYDPIEKLAFSCCGSAEFCSSLAELKRKNVVVIGIESHVCVLQTVLDLIEKDYQPIVIEDCVSSRKLNDKDIAIMRMRQEGAIISTYESILFELCRVAGTDKFKAISKIVK